MSTLRVIPGLENSDTYIEQRFIPKPAIIPLPTLEEKIAALDSILAPVKHITTKHLQSRLSAAQKLQQQLESNIANPAFNKQRDWIANRLTTLTEEINKLSMYITTRMQRDEIATPLKLQKAREYYHTKGAQARRDRKFFLRTLTLTPIMKEKQLYISFEKSGMAKYMNFDEWKKGQEIQGRITDGIFRERTRSEAELREEFYERIVLPEESVDYLPFGAPTVEDEQQFIQHRQKGLNYRWDNNTKELEQEEI